MVSHLTPNGPDSIPDRSSIDSCGYDASERRRSALRVWEAVATNGVFALTV